MFMSIEKMIMIQPSKKFKDVLEFSEWIENLPESFPKIITLRTVFKVTKMTIQPTKNEFGDWMGEVYTDAEIAAMRAKGDGDYYPSIQSKRTLEEGTLLDLNKSRDRKDWTWMKYNPAIALNKEEASTRRDKEFYIDFPEHEEAQELEALDTKLEAMNRIEQLPASDYRKVLNMLKMIVPEKISDARMKLRLRQKANESAQSARQLLDILNHSDFEMKSLLTDALLAKVIFVDGGVYKYESVTLGFSEEMVIEFLKKKINEDLAKEIFIRVRPDVPMTKEEALEDQKSKGRTSAVARKTSNTGSAKK